MYSNDCLNISDIALLKVLTMIVKVLLNFPKRQIKKHYA